ncbi:MAG: EAL domain-containing response regulator [Alphaproteobacteria bacterium]|nr:EAL domain-containing response regulator [Alphaproteobacteria bacterium]
MIREGCFVSRLLIIDDEEDICEIIAEVAQSCGFETSMVSDASLVMHKLDTFTPDAIVLDLMMPGMDGVELLRVLVDRVKNAKIILVSGSDARVLNSARRLGSAHGLDVVAALEKPLDIPLLRATLGQVTAGANKAVTATDVGQALAMGQMILYYQPIIEIATRRVKGAEALIRWAHPTRGILLPADFMEEIVKENLMESLTDYVLTTAVHQVARWHHAGEDLTVSINITASSLLDLTLPDRIITMCGQHQIPPEKLILEVTETEAMKDVTRTMDVLLRMRIRNIGVSIDDFGTGHSSLRELQRMPFSEMKIDKSFVMDVVSNRDCAVVVNSIINLGHNLGLKVTAEGVEDVRIWRMLAERHCDYAQGFYMAKPMPPEEFNRWMINWRESNRQEDAGVSALSPAAPIQPQTQPQQPS